MEECQNIKPAISNSSGATDSINDITIEINLDKNFTITIQNGNLITQNLLQPRFQIKVG